MSENTLTEKWVEFIDNITFDQIPPDVVHQTKMFILDQLGCAIGGYTLTCGKKVEDVGREMGGAPEASLIGTTEKLSCSAAAYVNGKLANLLDMDEVLYGCYHIGPSPVFPTLSTGEKVGASGRDIILAVALGYDFAARFALCAPIFLFDAEKGVLVSDHGTLAFNTFAAAVAAGKVFKANREQIVNTLTCAAHFAPGAITNKFSYTPPCNFEKYGDMGWFCHCGVLASICGRYGYTGDPSILDGSHGLIQFLGALTFDADTFVADLGKRWYIMDAGFKPYPCCRFFHTGIKLLEDIMKEQQLEPDEIESIVVDAHPGTMLPTFLSADKWAESANKDFWFSQFSYTFALSCTAHQITPGPRWAFEETLNDSKIVDMTKRVVHRVNQGATVKMMTWKGHPGRIMSEPPTSLSVMSKKGTFKKESNDLPGDCWNARAKLSDEELMRKFENNSRHLFRWSRIDEIIGAVGRLDEMENVHELTRLFAGEG